MEQVDVRKHSLCVRRPRISGHNTFLRLDADQSDIASDLTCDCEVKYRYY